uniref:Pyrrolo-quinoline quinone repeat domain-containing protein n=1 Tax=Fagus sylvatica TaxID=28930 RepID=A0A2N9EBW1_FAGSY
MALCLFTMVDNTIAFWLNHGRDITNRRYADDEVLISPKTVSRMKLKWKFFAGKDISATPAVDNGVVYFPSWNGYLYAVNAINGGLIWKQNLSALTGLNGTGIVVNVTVSRSTPTVVYGLLIIGIYGPAVVIAMDRSNGKLVWSTQLDPRPRVLITMSGTAYQGEFYVGVSSLEEALPANQCCTFRGSLAKLDVLTGKVLWRTYMLPDNGGKLGGYSGAAIWGSSPSIDINRRHVYVATGNLYTAPAEVIECQERQNNQTTKPSQPDQCIGPGPNLDADFGEAPMLLSIVANGTRRDVVVAVQKSGFAWALNRDDGSIVWFKLAGPGGEEGGGQWGAATDGRRVYTNIANSNRESFTLKPSNRTTTAGGWVAMNANSGDILWSTANPSNDTAQAPVTVANGVVFAGSVASNGPIYAMDADNGKILWSYNTGATVYGGASVNNGCITLGMDIQLAWQSFTLLGLTELHSILCCVRERDSSLILPWQELSS